MPFSVAQLWTVSLLSGLVLRLSVYLFLRWIFYEKYIVWSGAYAIYLAAWWRMDSILLDIESAPQRTMAKIEHNGHAKAEHFDPPAILPADPRLGQLPARASWSGLLLGGFTSSRVFNRFSLLIHTLLLLMAADNLLAMHVNPLYTANGLSYARVGAVGDTWARFSARIPDAAGARLIYRPTSPLEAWTVGPLLKATNETDFTTITTVKGLYASSQYEYRLAKPDSPMSIHPLFPSSQRFKTFPDPRLGSPSSFSFAASSCIKPGFPYVPFKSKFAIDGADYLADVIKARNLDFVMFLGDFICARQRSTCVYARLRKALSLELTAWWPGPQLNSYWKRYRQVYASPNWRRVFQSVPTMHIYDDHEFLNDYSGQDQPLNESAPILSHATAAYQHYNGLANPDPVHPGVSYYSFRHGDTAFFVWDTRRYRSLNTDVDNEAKTLLGSRQKADFLQWLSAVNHTAVFKFVVSSVPMMRLWETPDRAWQSDTWSSFLTERADLLDVMQYIPNLIVLSGDKHEFAAASIRQTVTEFSTSPLSQFYIPLSSLSSETADGEEIALRYESRGASKFSVFRVDTTVVNEPRVSVDVIIDGSTAWQVTIHGQAVQTQGRSLGALLPSLLDLLGLRSTSLSRRRWF